MQCFSNLRGPIVYNSSIYHFINKVPKEKLLTQWNLLTLIAERKDSNTAWKVQLDIHKLGGFSRPRPAYEVGRNGLARPTGEVEHILFDWEVSMLDWFTTVAKKRILINSHGMVYFEDPKDAVLFKLSWG